MKIRHLLYVILFTLAMPLSAQEIHCTVTINSDQIQGTNKSVFNQLQEQIQDYMNNNRWTNLTYSETERIEVSMLILIKSNNDGMYLSEMTLQSRRPVYGTGYSTPTLNLKDNNFNFTYQDGDRIEYQQSTFTTNLTAMLAYYCYLIIGTDMDTFSKLGGTPFFEQCEQIVTMAQSASLEKNEALGWRAFEDNKNRYALTNNLMDEAFHPYREFVYNYHRQGLDIMAQNVTNGRARIAEGIAVLRDANRARPATYLVNTFLDAKADELVEIFRKGTSDEKKNVYEILMDVDPTRGNTYDKINQ